MAGTPDGPPIDALMAEVYAELRRVAGAYLRRERPGQTLQPTALVNEAYLRLARQQARNVELRFFGGLSVEETAEAIGVSPATVKRHWSVARAWLGRELAAAA